MSNQRNNKKNNSTNRPANSQLQDRGRTSGSQNPEIEKANAPIDISSIDRQEGNLHHGECGGGLKSEDDC